MCHDDTSRPPAPPNSGRVADDRALALTSADGTRVLAHRADPAEPSGAGVVILPDVRGLHAFYVDLTRRMAEAGLSAVAVDYFGRTADTDDRSEAFAYRPHVERLTPDGVADDVAAAIEELRSGTPGAPPRAIFTLGFCMGGGQSWRQAAMQASLAGAIGFYGRPGLALDVADRVHAPLLLLPAGADQNIPVADVEAFADRVRAHGGDAEVHVFAGMPHSFFDRSFAEHADACASAWQVVLDFVHRHTPAGGS